MPVGTAECLLPAVGASVGVARGVVRRELDRWGVPELVDDCSLIVSELAANVVRHGGTVFTLRLGSNGAWVYGEVFDQGEGVPRPREADEDSTDGRGLMIVNELADDWGVARDARGGKTVWFIAGADVPRHVPVVPSRSRVAVG
ncbi:ATPase [Microbispora sp. ATCC PTA-5024]|nr:ATPase [Microbispora sp. ATCC PTA-5024]